MSDYEQPDPMDDHRPSQPPQPPESQPELPSIYDEETAEIDAIQGDALPPVPSAAPHPGESIPDDQADVHDRSTMAMNTESGAADFDDPKKTLPGSGGFDPNPDFTPEAQYRTPSEPRPPAPTQQNDPGYTVPHIVPFEHTLVHVPGDEKAAPPPRPRPPQEKKAVQFQQSYRPTPNAGQAQGQTVPNSQMTGRRAPISGVPGQGALPGQPAPSNLPPPPPGYAPQGNYPQQGYAQPQGYPPQPGMVPANIPLPVRRKPRRILGCTPGCVAVFVGIIVSFCGGLTLIALVLSATLGSKLEQQLTSQVAQVADYNNFQSTFYYDRNGELLYEAFTEGRRTNAQYEDFPQDLIDATVAIEDGSFWENPGFEVQATTRAFLQYVGLGEGSSGGSTITQQLVRNVLFDVEYRSERSIQRKIEEIALAYLLTQRMSKQDVLAMYLNEIYYGNMAYGAQAASHVFFDKDVQDLTLAEAALLAGLPQAPANYDPFNPDPEVQQAINVRWRTVLDRMVTEGYITNDERNQALRDGYSFNPPEAPLNAPHFTVYAQSELEPLLQNIGFSSDEIARGGLRVYTTVDLRIQDLAEQAAREQVASVSGYNVTNGAVIVTQPITGEILAMVGSLDYNNEEIDGRVNVTTAARQPGSTMKPFTYAAALERGMTLGDIIWDTETQIGDYHPVNYDRNWHGPVRIRTALANSYNIPAVQTLRSIGVDALLEITSRFGVESLGGDASQYGLSLTLGGGEISLLELTRGYSVFANSGVYVPTTSILCVIDNDGNVRYQYENGCITGNVTAQTVNQSGYGMTVLDPRIAYMITDILSDNAARSSAMGANSPLNTGGLFTAVKTGTTDDFRDNWTVGFNRNVAVGVWVGNSNGSPMNSGTTGLTGAAPIWNSVINQIYSSGLIDEFLVDGGRLPDQLDAPSGLTWHPICAISALREPALDCSGSIQELFMDSPVGLPDGQGGLQYQQPTPPPDDQQPASGVWLRLVEPDIYRVFVHPIPADIGQQIVLTMPSANGTVPPPPPLYCQLPIELVGSDPSAREQLFIAPPPDAADAARAETWARANGFAFLPTIACSPDLISATGGSNVITAFISQPTPGQALSAGAPILGTAAFTPQQATFYKLEITGGQFGSSWVTMNEVSYSAVVNGQLGYLPAVEPGSYTIQLVVVGLDGNYVQPPYQVPFTVQ